ncbi:hypothetical protein LCI18_004682 [Fusarium solani-melongenae]|uniref:Uncharacterized protein n=1 Tax=Fusarium solani subsp. cucurbitae TaxID=2747967 RepID=A0ACD3YXP3_FUSSC|nr:hypothetical protein LCI18_004682 [Fusarium solani-melongenae]
MKTKKSARKLSQEPTKSEPVIEMTTSKTAKSGAGLGNRTLLDKMDKLRELGISDIVPLPQMVVVGDQSAGKSSVLESLTGFHFPRSVTLCTRHATEIICRREETENIVVSIHAVDADKKEAQDFRRETKDLDAKEFARIFEDAAKVMGVRPGSDGDVAGSAFSRDVLRVEISGPNEDHLTVIDVPGMFENETPGVTTKEDIDLVKNMVRKYINESRTIILAVVPCNGDIANQKILTYAKDADPEGKRTLGVLTKPDLAVEKATKNVVVDLVHGKRRDLQLGYCVVKNRSADDTSSTADQRNNEERLFFEKSPWNDLPSDRLGIPALKTRIQQLLMDRTRNEFPKVRAELAAKLRENEGLLKDMGESRSTTEQQRIYVGRIAASFTRIKNYSLDAYYTRDEIFENEDLKLITRIREINERFGKVLYEKGHARSFASDANVDIPGSESPVIAERGDLYDLKATFQIPDLGEDELQDILYDPYHCPNPTKEDIMDHLEKKYLTSRGYELGTFSGEMLPTTFKEQSHKWTPMTRAHVSNAILIVHHFIRTVLDSCCPDPPVREELWNYLLDDLQNRYRRAVQHADFLLKVEFEGRSMTFNPVFDEKLEALRVAIAKGLRRQIEVELGCYETTAEAREPIKKLINETHVKTDSISITRRSIHDVLHTFYGIARSRFVDVVCQQVIDHFLLHAPDGPLAALSEEVVLHMTPEQLEAISGEDMVSRDRREKLTKDVGNLRKALRVLRG